MSSSKSQSSIGEQSLHISTAAADSPSINVGPLRRDGTSRPGRTPGPQPTQPTAPIPGSPRAVYFSLCGAIPSFSFRDVSFRISIVSSQKNVAARPWPEECHGPSAALFCVPSTRISKPLIRGFPKHYARWLRARKGAWATLCLRPLRAALDSFQT